jgi:hypothetical protein
MIHDSEEIIFANTIEGIIVHGIIERVLANTIEGILIHGSTKRLLEIRPKVYQSTVPPKGF